MHVLTEGLQILRVFYIEDEVASVETLVEGFSFVALT